MLAVDQDRRSASIETDDSSEVDVTSGRGVVENTGLNSHRLWQILSPLGIPPTFFGNGGAALLEKSSPSPWFLTGSGRQFPNPLTQTGFNILEVLPLVGIRLRPLPIELHDAVFEYLPLSDLKVLASVQRAYKPFVAEHLRMRVVRLLGEYFQSGDAALKAMERLGCVLSGSAALEVVVPGSCSPRNLNFYCAKGASRRMLRYMEESPGFSRTDPPARKYVAERDPARKLDVNNGVRRMYTFRHIISGRSVFLTESNSESPLVPIFYFHTSQLMNVVAGTGAICFYSELSDNYTGLKNLHPRFDAIHRPGVTEAWSKLGMGTREDCQDLHGNHDNLTAKQRRGMCQRFSRTSVDAWVTNMGYQPGQLCVDLGPVVSWNLGRHVTKGTGDVATQRPIVRIARDDWYLRTYRGAGEWVGFYVPDGRVPGLAETARWKWSFPSKAAA
ncbi:hypothetical protein D9611_008147 [Ephemerocybe angulata]|uniref:F-box domain-containing protein n=1 Tax=Ephemerocybe angulata TaxID=980116 RepID=A0A8H5BZF8_9AGAR|nr:hypothetical protein D9611_008147 [Tulosesus angulatus]